MEKFSANTLCTKLKKISLQRNTSQILYSLLG